MIHMMVWGLLTGVAGNNGQGWIPVSLATSLLLGYLLTRFFEAPARERIRKFATPAAVAAAAAPAPAPTLTEPLMQSGIAQLSVAGSE